jgi:hypothetical protein
MTMTTGPISRRPAQIGRTAIARQSGGGGPAYEAARMPEQQQQPGGERVVRC